MILDVAANIAQVLGFSIQAYDRFVNRNGQENASKHLGIFVTISPLTDAWKICHQQYHTIMPDISNLLSIITVYEGRNESTITLNKLKRSDLYSALTTGALGTAVSDFESRLLTQFEVIGNSNVDSGEINESIESIKQRTPAISGCITQLRESAKRTVDRHRQFCKFLSDVDGHLIDDDPHDDLYKMVLSKRRFIRQSFNEVILDCDRAIIASLSIFKAIADEAGGAP